MAIGAIEMQGQILRTQDYSAVKHQEDTRAEVAQANISQARATNETRQANRVASAQQSNKQQMNSDASDQGSNEYRGDGGMFRRQARAIRAEKELKEATISDGKVLIKSVIRE